MTRLFAALFIVSLAAPRAFADPQQQLVSDALQTAAGSFQALEARHASVREYKAEEQKLLARFQAQAQAASPTQGAAWTVMLKQRLDALVARDLAAAAHPGTRPDFSTMQAQLENEDLLKLTSLLPSDPTAVQQEAALKKLKPSIVEQVNLQGGLTSAQKTHLTNAILSDLRKNLAQQQAQQQAQKVQALITQMRQATKDAEAKTTASVTERFNTIPALTDAMRARADSLKNTYTTELENLFASSEKSAATTAAPSTYLARYQASLSALLTTQEQRTLTAVRGFGGH